MGKGTSKKMPEHEHITETLNPCYGTLMEVPEP